MSRKFARGTKLYEFEVMMTEVPNFKPRGGGIYIYKEATETRDIECEYCLDYKENMPCQKCPYLFERAALGTIDYETFMRETHKTVANVPNFQNRVEKIIESHDGNMFLDEEHSYRFYRAYSHLKTMVYSVKSYIMGAIYLLTTSEHLWEQVKDIVGPHSIEFEKVKMRTTDLNEYAFYQMARMIYDSVPRIKFSELADEELIDDDVFKAMINAMLVQKDGIEVLTLFTKNK